MKICLISQDKMCQAKDKGGMGYRNMSAFNDAILAKQAWRLSINPNTLIH